ncbi:MAG: hypothetical protein GC165_02130 [Armatimonadetes bacterium]|nr:hypothetical protein [Armatimonadota bacterium]
MPTAAARWLTALAIVGSLVLVGCGSGQVSPKEEKEIGQVMSKGLGAPGSSPSGGAPAGGPPKGAGQMKHGLNTGQPPSQPATH